MSDTKIKMPFPDKGDFAESNLNVDDIKEHLLDWLIGCYDKGEIICNLLPAYMADIEERFSEKENPNLERTKEYLKEAFTKLENERIDTAVQKRTKSNEDGKKKLNLNCGFFIWKNPKCYNSDGSKKSYASLYSGHKETTTALALQDEK